MDGVVPVTPDMNRARVANPVTPWTVIRDPREEAPIKVQGVSVRTATAEWTLKRPAAWKEVAVRGAGLTPRTLE